jgi:GNAT superfamily N-acetyltransferase
MESGDENVYLAFIGRLKSHPFPRRYQWLYKENPHGEALTWLVIHHRNGTIIGATSIFPRRVWLRDGITLGCCGGDTFVDPTFQRRGIATELHRASRPGAAEAGIRFQYGLPNVANAGAHQKAGSYFPGGFQEIRILLRIEPVINKLNLGGILPTGLLRLGSGILWLYIKPKLSKSIDWDKNIKIVSEFDRRFDKLMESVTPAFNICGVRDSGYLNWRYFKNPLRVHTILSYEEQGILQGFAALEFYKDRCYLFDFFIKREDELVEKFISCLIKFVMSKGSHMLTWIANPTGPYIKNFLQFAFRIKKGSNFPLEVHLPHEDKDLKYLTKLENWYLSYADFDYESATNTGDLSQVT